MASIGAWWQNLDPDTQQALILAGAEFGQDFFQNRAEEGRFQQGRQDTAITNRAEGIQSIDRAESRDREFLSGRDDARAATAGRMAGNSPLQFQGDRAKMALTRALLSGGSQGATFSGMPGNISRNMPKMQMPKITDQSALNFLSNDSMASAEAPYWQAQANIDPRLKGPDLSAVGYGGAGQAPTDATEQFRTARLAEDQAADEAYKGESAARRKALMDALQELDPREQNKQKKGGSGWKTAAGIGLGAAGLFF